MPTTAVTTLRQYRNPRGTRIHGRHHPATAKAYRTSPAASTHHPTVGAAATLSTRMRNASTSPSKRPPNAVTVPVRRATRPSTVEEFIDTPVQFYSSGMRARLGFALSVVMQPDILLD